MKDLYTACRALYAAAFPEEESSFADALFARYFPRCLRVMGAGSRVVSMLFSIPYPIQTENGVQEARYIYAVATAPDYRGQGLATRLLRAEIARGKPVFLRPSAPSLFKFYEKAGFTPFSPVRAVEGEAVGEAALLPLTAAEYLARRATLLEKPFAVPTDDFLSLVFADAKAVATPDGSLALLEQKGDTVHFKEFLGNPDFAPRLAASLGAERYTCRTYDADGTSFAVGAHLPQNVKFLLALD